MGAKRYKLLKDLPGCIVGDIVLFNDKTNTYRVTGDLTTDHVYTFPKTIVENNHDWFKPEEPERIEVTDFRKGAFYKDPRINESSYQLVTSMPIPYEKYPAIKKSIEDVLNNDMDDLSIFDKEFPKQEIEKLTAQYRQMTDHLRKCKYTEEDLKNAFYAGRAILSSDKYQTFQDYLNFINNKP